MSVPAPSAPSDTTDLRALYDLIHERTGLRVSDTQSSEVGQVVDSALASLQVQGVAQLLPVMARVPLHHPVWRDLIHVITIGETYFFRNQDQFGALRNDVLPALIEARRKNGQKQLRLWSAGCATGEEPYSLAILLRELLPDYDTWHVALIATDINLNSLERARQAIFRKWSFREETPPHIRDRWFTPEGETYRLDASIRSSVVFQPLNLVSDDYPSFASGTMNMDLIMCRNVTIYFEQATTRQVISRFLRALVPDGWLVVGHAEPLSSLYEGLTPRNFPHAVLYRKAAVESAPLARAAIVDAEVAEPLPARTSEISALTQDTRGDGAPGSKRHTRKRPADHPASPGSTERVSPPAAVPTANAASDAWLQAKQAADTGNWRDALVYLAQAEEEDKFQPQVYHLRGLIQRHIGDTDGALASLRQAIYCDTSFALAHYELGEIYETTSKRRQAARCWRLAQEAIAGLKPDDPVPFADDMTVRMLQDLLAQRLSMLTKKS